MGADGYWPIAKASTTSAATTATTAARRGTELRVLAPGLIESVVRAVESTGLELRAWSLGWARVTPAIFLVPAFGLRALPNPARIALGLAIGAAIAPAVHPIREPGLPWAVSILIELARGLPVALSAAIVLWVATMAGSLVDDLRGAREHAAMPSVEPGATPSGVLVAMLVAIAFLESGGPARVASALIAPELGFGAPLARAARDLAHGIELAVAVGAPVVGTAIVVEVGSTLVARAANPAHVMPLLAPLRSLAILGVFALVLERIVALLALYAAHVP